MELKALKLWEAERLDDYGCRRAVPGGWLVSEWNEFGGFTTTEIKDPTAPHCQPTQAEAPPMTDEALREWLTATYGDCRPVGSITGGGALAWSHDDRTVCRMYHDELHPWRIGTQDGRLPASIAGPALWAAHKYGVAG